jgi:hypothetical protein
MWCSGTVLATVIIIVVLAQACFTFKTWTWLHVASIAISIVMYIAFIFVYAALPASFAGAYYGIPNIIFNEGLLYVNIFFWPFLLVAPTMALVVLRRQNWANLMELARVVLASPVNARRVGLSKEDIYRAGAAVAVSGVDDEQQYNEQLKTVGSVGGLGEMLLGQERQANTFAPANQYQPQQQHGNIQQQHYTSMSHSAANASGGPGFAGTGVLAPPSHSQLGTAGMSPIAMGNRHDISTMDHGTTPLLGRK